MGARTVCPLEAPPPACGAHGSGREVTLSLTGKKTDRAPSVGRQPSLCAVYTKAIEYTQAIEYTPSIFAFSFPFFPSVACVLLQVEAGTKQGEERYALKRQATKERNKKRSTGPSRVVPHRSTTPASNLLSFAVRMESGEPG